MFLLDTDTIVFSLRDEPVVVANFALHASSAKAISVITYAELLYGAEKSNRREENLARVRRVGEIFPVIEGTRSVLATFASLKANLEREGKRLDDFDLIIAATALTLNYKLVTNNEKHFRRIPGLRIENWTKNK